MTEIDYDKAKIPMLPNVSGEERTKSEIIYYTILLVAASLALYPLHVMGAFTPALPSCSAESFSRAVQTWRDRQDAGRARTFRFSLLYLALMCVVMVIDRIIS